MADPERPLLADLKEEVSRAGSELGEMARLRWQLARLELNESIAQVKRLAIVLAVAAVMALTALPVLVVWAAETVALHTDDSPFPAHGWMLIFASALLLIAGLGGFLAYRRFRRQFTGLEQTIEEVREDLIWLRDWVGQEEEP